MTLTGTWQWDRNQCDAVNDRYVGWAVDWDDPNAPGHLVPANKKGGQSYLVGTPNDNTVHTNGDCGAPGGPGVQGTWGPISHTYAAPGQYEVCVVTYDIHRGDEGKVGGHGLIAGGPDRNKDNSVEKNAFTPNQGGVDCAPTTIVIPGNLTARKTVDKAVAKPGDTLLYTITVANNSQGAVNNATVSDNISALLARGTFQAGTPAAQPDGNGDHQLHRPELRGRPDEDVHVLDRAEPERLAERLDEPAEHGRRDQLELRPGQQRPQLLQRRRGGPAEPGDHRDEDP